MRILAFWEAFIKRLDVIFVLILENFCDDIPWFLVLGCPCVDSADSCKSNLQLVTGWNFSFLLCIIVGFMALFFNAEKCNIPSTMRLKFDVHATVKLVMFRCRHSCSMHKVATFEIRMSIFVFISSTSASILQTFSQALIVFFKVVEAALVTFEFWD